MSNRFVEGAVATVAICVIVVFGLLWLMVAIPEELYQEYRLKRRLDWSRRCLKPSKEAD